MDQQPATADNVLARAAWMSTPRHHPGFMGFARWLAPRHLRYVLGIHRMLISPEHQARLEALRGQRVVLTPNHPAFDPVVVFNLSARLRMAFYYLTARELFSRPVDSFIISRIGAYAIERGTHDNDALHTSRRLIREGEHWLVLFPEGEAHYLHDTVLPFLPGAARLGLGALSDLAQAGPPPPVYLAPIALRYYCLADMREQMLASLSRLEQRLDLSAPDPPLGWHERLGRIADHVLDCNEAVQGLEPVDEHNLQARLDTLRETLLSRAASALGIDVPLLGQPLRNRLRKIIVAAKRISHTPPQTGGAYAERLYQRLQAHTALLQRELARVVEFVSLTGTYSYDVPTVENYLDVLGRLELEVLGKPRHWAPRAVQVLVGEPVDLREYYAAYQRDPEAASQQAISAVERQVHAMLAQSASLMHPLPEQ